MPRRRGRQGGGTHRATPLRGGEMHVGDEEHGLRLQVALGPQERDLIPSEAREQTAFQTYGWRVQFISAPSVLGQDSPAKAPSGNAGAGQEPAAPAGQPRGAQNHPQSLVGARGGLGEAGKEPSKGLAAQGCWEQPDPWEGAARDLSTDRCCWSPGIFLSFGTVSFRHPSFSSLLPVGRSSNIQDIGKRGFLWGVPH